jgi:hypothetical protein
VSSSVAPFNVVAPPAGRTFADWFGHGLEIVNAEAEISAAV